MKIQGKDYHTIWPCPDNPKKIMAIDQRKLPFSFEIFAMDSVEKTFFAIKEMVVRGAPLIGVTGAYGLYLALLENQGAGDWKAKLQKKAQYLMSARPTAINLARVVQENLAEILKISGHAQALSLSLSLAEQSKAREIAYCEAIGLHGLALLKKLQEKKKGETLNILTHCNAGWLACIDWGTATAPIYKAHQEGIDLHVWVDETRPRNQGARLTAFELLEMGIPHTVIADNTGGHLMQHGKVDMVIVGSDRTTRRGDVANKIGTYLKALAAYDNQVPFYVALPSTTFDWEIRDGVAQIPIEERSADEVREMQGISQGREQSFRILPQGSPALNYGFDVTPARLVSALITERGICPASEQGIAKLFPESNK